MLAYLGGPNFPLAFRRGWTHGVLALFVLPVVLTAVLAGLDRLVNHLRGAVLPSDVRPRQLLLLSCIAVWSHPILDTLNVYGVRWLMPFAERWYYGDILFIVDPWLIAVLGVGVWLSRRRARSRELFHIHPLFHLRRSRKQGDDDPALVRKIVEETGMHDDAGVDQVEYQTFLAVEDRNPEDCRPSPFERFPSD